MNRSGMTLIEVLVSIGISLICVSVYLQMTLSNRTHRVQVDKSIFLKEVLTNNVIEVKSTDISSLPVAGECLVRAYDSSGVFQNQSKVSGSGDLCGVDGPAQNQIQIVWEVHPSSEIVATFNNPSLKLPQYSNTLKKIVLHVRGYTLAGALLVQNQITVFKR